MIVGGQGLVQLHETLFVTGGVPWATSLANTTFSAGFMRHYRDIHVRSEIIWPMTLVRKMDVDVLQLRKAQ